MPAATLSRHERRARVTLSTDTCGTALARSAMVHAGLAQPTPLTVTRPAGQTCPGGTPGAGARLAAAELVIAAVARPQAGQVRHGAQAAHARVRQPPGARGDRVQRRVHQVPGRAAGRAQRARRAARRPVLQPQQRLVCRQLAPATQRTAVRCSKEPRAGSCHWAGQQQKHMLSQLLARPA